MIGPRLSLACAAGLLASGAALAHHSPLGTYDLGREMIVEGTIAKVSWKNPHIYFVVETRSADGALERHEIEADGPAAVQTAGLTREQLALGARVSVRGAPSRRGQSLWAMDVTLSDGAVYPLGPRGRASTAPPAAPPAAGLAGKWAPTVASFGELVQAATQTWPLTEAGLAARADVATTLASAAGCSPYPQPMLMGLHVLRTIEIGEDAVVIRVDWMGAERVVHLDQSEHPDDIEPSLFGHSIGWWEGETLVIDTAGFAPHRQGVMFGVPSGPGKHMVERLSLTEDRRRLRYETTLTDPEHLAEPVSHTGFWEHRPDLEPSEACDPEVATRFLEE